MPPENRVSLLCEQLRLSPYQSYVLENNAKKYNLDKLVKRGGILYAPHAYDDRGNLGEYLSRLLFGPRADLVGLDKMLVSGQRRVKIYSSGIFSAYRNGLKYYADAMGNRASKNL